MKNRGWSIRAKIMTLAIVPLVAITALSIFGVAVTAGSALNLLDAIYYEQAVTDNGEKLMVELQKERRLSAGAKPGDLELAKQRLATDGADRAFRQQLGDLKVTEELPADKLALVESFTAELDLLPALRQDIDQGRADHVALVRRYSELIDSAYQMFSPLTDLSDHELASLAHGLFSISRARELLAREDAAITGAIADGKVSVNEQGLVLRAIGARRQQHEEARAALADSPHHERFEAIFAGSAYTSIYGMEESFVRIRGDRRVPIEPASWRGAVDSVLGLMDHTEDTAAEETVMLANDIGIRTFILPVAVALLGLICAAGSLILALRTGRSVVHRLERLRVSALEVAHDRLPRAIATLRQPGGAAADPDALDIPMVAVGSDEVGQVGYAFGAVQRTAIRAAVDEATLRKGLSDVFLNIARRSQALLHRQLTLLDRMERRTTEPQELEDLFRLDHMATRMRRHAEALVILAGSAPGRGWRHPVPLVDVVRGATSEIEEYVRVNLDRMPDVRILGRAVGDLIHLLAELLENATSFAPPHTRVRVHAEAVSNGLALHIEDRGLGMSDAELAETNARLADPPPFDPGHSARLGLLVVAKLAARQGIAVHLRTSPYGGITAVVLVPSELVQAEVVEQIKPRKLELNSAEVELTEQELTPLDDLPQPPPGGLPKRVRRSAAELAEAAAQESTSQLPAPRQQLQPPEETTVRLTPAAQDETTITIQPATVSDVPRPRSADQVRTMMSAFQTGSARGRAKAIAIEAEAAGAGAAELHNADIRNPEPRNAEADAAEESAATDGQPAEAPQPSSTERRA